MDESASRLGPGVVLDGSYELLSVLGSGGMGTVWRAQHRRLPKQVAVKVLKGAEKADRELIARFRREAEIASRLEHPHIVEALDFNTLADGTPYMVLELLSGESLRARLQRGPIELAEAVEIVRQTGSALTAAHAQGVVHRDLKPENIFLCAADERLRVKVLDFGLSRITGGDTALTKDGAVFGTPLYMAPEQAQGAPADARSDQHALAMVLFEMLHGRPAFVAEQPLQVLFRIVHEPAPWLADLCPSLPTEVSAAVARALAKVPRDRFPDIRSFVQAISVPLGLATSATPIGGVVATLKGAGPVGNEATLTESDPKLAAAAGSGAVAKPAGRTISGREATVDLGSAQTMTPPPKTLPPLEPDEKPLPKTLPPLAPDEKPPELSEAQRRSEPPPKPRVGLLGAALLGALGVGLVGGGVLWLRGARSPTTTPGKASALDRGAPATVADARRTVTDRVAPVRDAGVEADQRPRARPDARRSSRIVRAAPPLPEALAERLRAAETLLQDKRYGRAGVEAEKLERDLLELHKWRASFLRARVHCALLQRTDAEGAYRRLPPAARARALRYCRQFIPDFNP